MGAVIGRHPLTKRCTSTLGRSSNPWRLSKWRLARTQEPTGEAQPSCGSADYSVSAFSK
jgi:hypothetical protein